jgi:hypothetical protein
MTGHTRAGTIRGCIFLAALLTSIPAFAQRDIVGEWDNRFDEDFLERIPGPDIGDYLGLPINDAARLHADSWDASLLTLPEHQCKPHPSDYGIRGPAQMRVWKEVDTATQELIAYHTHIFWQAPERVIWMDGRAHPPDFYPHTWQGFSTGKWEGDVLTVTTTHLKMGWIRRNGVPRSENAVITEHWVRHGNYLTVATMVNDPAYLTETFPRTTDFVMNPDQKIPAYPCEAVVEVERPLGAVPHHLPGTNAFLNEFGQHYAVPLDAARGGAETMYPEYRLKMGPAPAAQPDSKAAK